MARFIVLLLVALLPLRGWTADRMALQMSHESAAQTQSVVSVQINFPMMSADCDMHMMDDAADVPDAKALGHNGCSSCQLCTPLAAQNVPVQIAIVFIPSIAPCSQAGTFVSVDPTQAVKPPIS